ncbi:MAG: hypothetical protein KF886_05810 [Candidatus Hydrogenedentes bacterium]|nr:hypothetical protein [Candidatus Hydrogenedentota bacterium]
MPRYVPDPTSQADHLLQLIGQFYDSTPLSPIGERLNEAIQALLDCRVDADLGRAFTDIHRLLERLPHGNNLGDRFCFDAELIASIRDDWSGCSQYLGSMIIPKYGDEWGHHSMNLPNFKDSGLPRVDLVVFCGGDSLDCVSLLNYPWLIHELAHNLFIPQDSIGCANLTIEINRFVRGCKLRSFSASAHQQTAQNAKYDSLEKAWLGYGSGGHWLHELAADAVTVWTLGPAFLAAFIDTVENPHPFHTNAKHPSYEMRTMSLLNLAEKLGWSSHVEEMKNLLEKWTHLYGSTVTNDYLQQRRASILDAAAIDTFNLCERLQLPLCDQSMITQVTRDFESSAKLEFNSKLLLFAWQAERSLTKSEYRDWERSALHQLTMTPMQ